MNALPITSATSQRDLVALSLLRSDIKSDRAFELASKPRGVKP